MINFQTKIKIKVQKSWFLDFSKLINLFFPSNCLFLYNGVHALDTKFLNLDPIEKLFFLKMGYPHLGMEFTRALSMSPRKMGRTQARTPPVFR